MKNVLREIRDESDMCMKKCLSHGIRIRNGRPEGQAYTEFGRRCGTYPYIKFGNILEQNLKQGIAGISRALEREMTDALEARKNLALKRGEEAQTKLLLPMFLMLGIVLVILLVPAFLSF